MKHRKILAIAGAARSGKDTFGLGLSLLRPEKVETFAFANELKKDLEFLIYDQFGWNIFKLTDEQKKIVRPILVAYGCAWRAIDIDHWVKIVVDTILENDRIEASTEYIAVTDCRFTSEISFLKKSFGDDVILVSIHRDGVEPANEEERYNQPLVDALADYHVYWPSLAPEEKEKTLPYIENFLNLYNL